MHLMRFIWFPGCCLLGCLLLYPTNVCGQSVPDASSSVSKTLSLHIPLTQRHAIELSTEYVRVESFPKSLAKEFFAQPSWRYKAIPITLGYAYTLTNPDRRIVPVVGVGVSLYFGSAKQFDYVDVMVPLDTSLSFQQSFGVGYGAQATFGFRANLNQYMFIQAQGRARYINGLGLISSDVHTYRSEFTKLDFVIGFGFTL